MQIAREDPNNRWPIVEGHRDVMDEYLEWSTNVDSDGNIQYVVFTCEGFEVSRGSGAVRNKKSKRC